MTNNSINNKKTKSLLKNKVISTKKEESIGLFNIFKTTYRLHALVKQNASLEQYIELIRPYILNKQLNAITKETPLQVILFIQKTMLKALLNTHTLNAYSGRIMTLKKGVQKYFLRHIETGEIVENGSRFFIQSRVESNKIYVTIKSILEDLNGKQYDKTVELPVELSPDNKMYLNVPNKADLKGNIIKYRQLFVYFENGFCYLHLNSDNFYTTIIDILMEQNTPNKLLFPDTAKTADGRSFIKRGIQTNLTQTLITAIKQNVDRNIYTAEYAENLASEIFKFLYGNRTFIPLYKGEQIEGLAKRITLAQTNDLVPLHNQLLDAIQKNITIEFMSDNTCKINGKQLYNFKTSHFLLRKLKILLIQYLLAKFSNIFTSYRVITRKINLDKQLKTPSNYPFSVNTGRLTGSIQIEPIFKEDDIYTKIEYTFSHPLVDNIDTIRKATQIHLLTSHKDVLLSDNTIFLSEHIDDMKLSENGRKLSIFLKYDTFGQNMDLILRPLIGVANQLPFVSFNKTQFAIKNFDLPPIEQKYFWKFLAEQNLLDDNNLFHATSENVGKVYKQLSDCALAQNTINIILDTLIDNIPELPFLWITNGKLILIQDFAELSVSSFIYDLYKTQTYQDDKLDLYLKRDLHAFKALFKKITTTSTLSKNIIPLIEKINERIAEHENRPTKSP